ACERLASILFEDAGIRSEHEISLSMIGRNIVSVDAGQEEVRSFDAKTASGLNGMLELAKYFRQKNPDIVQILSSGFSTLAPGAARLAGVKTVVQSFAHGEQQAWRVSTAAVLASSMAADVLVAASEATRRKLQSDAKIGKSSACVVYADLLPPLKFRSAAQLRARMGLPPGQLLFAADLSADSGPSLGRLFKAFAALRSKVFFKNMPVLAVCGLSNERLAEAAQLAAGHGLKEDVVFYGNDESAREAAAACDVFVSPCAGPGDFHPAILAAMSSGKTVVASKEGMTPELLESSKSGILVKPGDWESLYRALELVTNDTDLKIKMGYAAKNRFDQYFRPGSTAQAYLDIYIGRKVAEVFV
ncbi:MAG TPA: glycosyltransferase family 4 protein, partial [Elusimicrobiales bacterium]|nr:glycosyltransferase family 4 protein [Elusimicrobiales bacterium]